MIHAAGGSYLETTMVDIDLQTLHEAMTINFESNFCESFLSTIDDHTVNMYQSHTVPLSLIYWSKSTRPVLRCCAQARRENGDTAPLLRLLKAPCSQWRISLAVTFWKRIYASPKCSWGSGLKLMHQRSKIT
jgi:hypothetical protein